MRLTAYKQMASRVEMAGREEFGGGVLYNYCLEIEIKIKIMVKNNVQDAIATVDLLAGK